jgi:transcriptional regulator with XRE-family HTH domain
MKIKQVPSRDELGNQVRILMAEKNWDRQQLANEVGTSKTTASAIRQGRASYKMLTKAIQVLSK